MQRGAEVFYSPDDGGPAYKLQERALSAVTDPEPLKWDPWTPIAYWPNEDIQDLFRTHADYLIRDLQEHRLTVVLAPAPDPQFDGHCIRVVEQENPDWWKDIYSEHLRRCRAIPALERIAVGKDKQTTPYKMRTQLWRPPKPGSRRRVPMDVVISSARHAYDGLLRQIIFEHLTEGYNTEVGYEPPVYEVCEFFGKPTKNAERFLTVDGDEAEMLDNMVEWAEAAMAGIEPPF